MADESGRLRWGVERRLAFLDACLFWANRVNRSDLVRKFGISVQQASADLARYFELAPGNARYDRKQKTYLCERSFKPVVSLTSPQEILEELERVNGANTQGEGAPWALDVVAERAVPRSNRTLDASVLQALLSAVRERHMVRVSYQSFSKKTASLRWIAPHAFADDGDRWHVRAFCAEHKDFRDFLVSRIAQVKEPQNSPVPSAADHGWNSFTVLKLGPNPRLEAGQRRALETEHDMVNGSTDLTVRICFAYYVIRRFGLDLDDAAVPPERKQLVLMNADEVQTAEERAESGTAAEVARLLAAQKSPDIQIAEASR